jgi:hypothetical protein
LRDQPSAAGTRHSQPSAFSLFLIESALWSRFMPEPTGIGLNIHTAGPGLGEPVVLIETEQQLEACRRELIEAREQQAGTSEVLRG